MKIFLNEKRSKSFESKALLYITTSKIHNNKLRFSFFQSKQFVKSFVIIWLDGFHVIEKNAFPEFKRTNGSWCKKSNNHNFLNGKVSMDWKCNLIIVFQWALLIYDSFQHFKKLIKRSFSSYVHLIRKITLYVKRNIT